MSQWVSMWFSQCMRSIRETMGEWGREGQSNSKGLYNHIYNIYICVCVCVCVTNETVPTSCMVSWAWRVVGSVWKWVGVWEELIRERVEGGRSDGGSERRKVEGGGVIFICVLLKARSQPLSWFPHIEIDASRYGMYATTTTTTTIPRQIFSSKTSQ